MRTMNLRAFRANISKEIENLPLAVTRYGKVVAVVVSADVPRGGDSRAERCTQTNPSYFNPRPKKG